ncbi:MAG: GtrA family protein [Candidatus Caldarchaeum sp.]
MNLRSFFTTIEIVRFAKFAVVGVVGLVLNTVLLYVLTTFVFGERLYLVAAVLSLEASILNNFLLNEYWTFKDRVVSGGFFKRMLKFHGSRVLGAATSIVVLFLLTEYIGLHYLLSNLVGVVLGTAVNYLTSNFWVWA